MENLIMSYAECIKKSVRKVPVNPAEDTVQEKDNELETTHNGKAAKEFNRDVKDSRKSSVSNRDEEDLKDSPDDTISSSDADSNSDEVSQPDDKDSKDSLNSTVNQSDIEDSGNSKSDEVSQLNTTDLMDDTDCQSDMELTSNSSDDEETASEDEDQSFPFSDDDDTIFTEVVNTRQPSKTYSEYGLNAFPDWVSQQISADALMAARLQEEQYSHIHRNWQSRRPTPNRLSPGQQNPSTSDVLNPGQQNLSTLDVLNPGQQNLSSSDVLNPGQQNLSVSDDMNPVQQNTAPSDVLNLGQQNLPTADLLNRVQQYTQISLPETAVSDRRLLQQQDLEHQLALEACRETVRQKRESTLKQKEWVTERKLQNSEYELSLKADQEKLRQTRERERKEQDRLKQIEERKSVLRAGLVEVSDGATGSIQLVLQFGDGKRIRRTVHENHTLISLYAYIYCQQELPDMFTVLHDFPRRRLPCDPQEDGSSQTFKEAGVRPRSVLYVSEVEEDTDEESN